MYCQERMACPSFHQTCHQRSMHLLRMHLLQHCSQEGEALIRGLGMCEGEGPCKLKVLRGSSAHAAKPEMQPAHVSQADDTVELCSAS